MKIDLADIKRNITETYKIGSLKNFKEDYSDLSKIDVRNGLNELTLKDWISHTQSFHCINKIVPKDSLKSCHPATFEEELPCYYIEFFSNKNDIVFDPFLGTGTTSIASNLLGRRSVGIEINHEFIKLAKRRFKVNGLKSENHFIFEGDSYNLLRNKEISSFLEEMKEKITFTITSPPYHNILKYNYDKKDLGTPYYRNYGNHRNNLENIKDYNQFLVILTNIFEDIYKVMKNKSYLLINVKNYYRKVLYRNGKRSQEIVFFAWDLAKEISKTRWIPCGEQIWANPNKKLFPFGFPYIYLTNITHSYNLIFHKDISKK